jgi:hypothetical protein
MPTHDWSRVEAGIFHHFHHAWIDAISRSLNRILPRDYYAMAEQHAGGLGPDVLTLQLTERGGPSYEDLSPLPANGTGVCLAPPPVALTAEGEMDFYHRKQNTVVVRHVSGHRVVAMIEIVSPGNKANQYGLDSFVRKACELFDRDIHLLVLDLHRPGPRDPSGIHGAIWDYFQGQPYTFPLDRPITLAAYECDLSVRAYVQHLAVGDALPLMPLFLYRRGHVLVPLEESYQAAFEAMPRIWRTVLE